MSRRKVARPWTDTRGAARARCSNRARKRRLKPTRIISILWAPLFKLDHLQWAHLSMRDRLCCEILVNPALDSILGARVQTKVNNGINNGCWVVDGDCENLCKLVTHADIADAGERARQVRAHPWDHDCAAGREETPAFDLVATDDE